MDKAETTVESYLNYLWEETPRSTRDVTTYLMLSGGYHALLLPGLLLFHLTKVSLERRCVSLLSVTL